MQKFQNTNVTKKHATKYKWKKIQMQKCQNTNTTKYKGTKYYCNKIQMQQNTNKTKPQYLMYLHMKVCFLLKQYRGITLENQRVKGGGLIYLHASH